MMNPRRRARSRGLTLPECAVVILALLGLVSMLFIGGRAWKRNSDRAGCILNIHNAQQVVRSFQKLNDHPVGTSIHKCTEIAGELDEIGACPGGGHYHHAGRIPGPGTLVMWCELATLEGHEPAEFSGW